MSVTTKMDKNTVELLEACNAGTVTAVNCIKEVMPSVKNPELASCLEFYLTEHEKIGNEIHKQLNELGEVANEPSPLAQFGCRVTTDMKMMLDNSDEKIAQIMTDGCNTAMKALGGDINKYPDASPASREMAQRLMKTEENFMERMRDFL